MLEDKPLIDLRFPAGKNNVSRETELPSGAARELLNVDLTNSGELSRRKGYTSVYSSSRMHSLFSTKDMTVFLEDTTLKRLKPDFSTTDIRTGLDPDNPISYIDAPGGLIYYSNGDDNGVITADGQHDEWGVDAPVGQPNLLQSTGSLNAGTYQVAITYLSTRGEESGSTLATQITVPNAGGVQLINIAQSDAASVNVYVTATDGQTLYWQANVPMGTTEYSFTTLNKGRALETQFMERMPPGQIVRGFRGRAWVAVGDLLIFSPALRYGLYDPRFDYFRFPARIDILQIVQDGVYVTSDATYFLEGNDPQEFKQTSVYPYPGVPGTGLAVPASKFNEDNDLIGDASQEDVAFWYSTHGAVIGYPGGNVKPVTEDRVSIPEYEKGATLLREEDGIKQLVTSLTGKGSPNSFGVTDSAVAEVRRNGVTV